MKVAWNDGVFSRHLAAIAPRAASLELNSANTVVPLAMQM